MEQENTQEQLNNEPMKTNDYSAQRPTMGRSPRPRIQNKPRSTSSSYERQPYQRQGDDSQGFRPEGFGAPLQGQQRPYRPRTYNNSYSQQNDRYQHREGGYQPREGGYQPREGGYQQREGGYQPRPRYQQNDRYQQGDRYQQPREGGYQPRPYNAHNSHNTHNTRSTYNSRPGYDRQQRQYNSNYQKPRRPRTPDYDPNAKYSLKMRIEYKEQHFDPNEPIRLNKYLANAGVCSRREADEFIQAGVVTVNGQVVTELGTKVLRTDQVHFHDQLVNPEKKVYVLLNKPKDYVTTSDDPQQRKTVMDLVKDACSERIYPVGRLDRNTTGVLLLTNDGDMASKLTHPKYLKKKIYHVYLDRNVTAHDLQQIAEGIQLEDGAIRADDVQYASPTDKKQVGIEIHSGKNRIVRRIFEALGYKVTKLDRVQFAGLTKKNLRRGDWRYLTEEEVDRLRMGAYE